MSEYLHYFQNGGRFTAVALPFRLKEFVRDWIQLRVGMTKRLPTAFSRDEWAYLISFLDEENLWGIFRQSFGQPLDAIHGLGRERSAEQLGHPRGRAHGVFVQTEAEMAAAVVGSSHAVERIKFAAGRDRGDVKDRSTQHGLVFDEVFSNGKVRML